MNEQIERILALYAKANECATGEECLQIRRLAAEMLMYEMERGAQQPIEPVDYTFFTKSQAKDYVSNHRLEFFANCMRSMATNPNISAAEVNSMLWMAQRELKREEEK